MVVRDQHGRLCGQCEQPRAGCLVGAGVSEPENGQATLVFTTAGEQRMDFRTHNTAWETVDFDGIKLMRRPPPQAEQTKST